MHNIANIPERPETLRVQLSVYSIWALEQT